MTEYIMNKNSQENGDHEVHKITCDRRPNPENWLKLGDFPSCHGAVKKAKEYDSDADGCFYCSPDCHTS